MSYFDTYQRAALYTDEYTREIGSSRVAGVISGPWQEASADSVVDAMLATDVETYLPGDLLVKMDIATMAHSLEARSPLLDPEVMELAASLPSHLKVRGIEKKVALRDALSPWLPRPLLDRPKMGFGVPLGHWFRHELREHAYDVLLDQRTLGRGYFRRAYIERMLASHMSGQEDNSPRIWSLLMSELWHRAFVDRRTTTAVSVA